MVDKSSGVEACNMSGDVTGKASRGAAMLQGSSAVGAASGQCAGEGLAERSRAMHRECYLDSEATLTTRAGNGCVTCCREFRFSVPLVVCSCLASRLHQYQARCWSAGIGNMPGLATDRQTA